MIITAIDKHIFGREKMGFIQWKVWYMYLLFRVFVMSWLNVKECLDLFHSWPCICSVCCNQMLSFSQSWLITRFLKWVTQWVPLVEQELLTIPEHLCSVLWTIICLSLSFYLASVLSTLLQFTTSDYHIGIFKLFLFSHEHSSCLNFFSPTCPKAKFRKNFYLFKKNLS
jgi:hypothetical protein